MDITLENYEFAFFQYEEGLLTPEERRQVEAFCQEHPGVGEELGLAMECPKLQPLEVEAPKGRHAIVVPLWAKRALSAAACVALLIGIGVQLWQPAPAPQPEERPIVLAENRLPEPQAQPAPKVGKVLKDFKDPKDIKDPNDLKDFCEPAPAAEAPAAWEEAPVSWGEPGALYAEGAIQQIDSEEFQLLLAQNYIEASELLAQADAPAPKSEEELAHPIATWLARQKEAAFMQLAEFFTQKFNH